MTTPIKAYDTTWNGILNKDKPVSGDIFVMFDQNAEPYNATAFTSWKLISDKNSVSGYIMQFMGMFPEKQEALFYCSSYVAAGKT